jgi:hypothetical protein
VSQQELLIHVAAALDGAGIDYMFTGSIVSSLQGEPRLTHDIDVVVSIRKDQVPAVMDAFAEPRFYLDSSAAEEAIRTSGMFQAIDSVEGGKIDFRVLRDEPFDRSRFRRKYTERLFGEDVQVSTPEDTILAKLWWANLYGGSEKYFHDALRVYEIQSPGIDDGYLDEWARHLEVEELLGRIRSTTTRMDEPLRESDDR